MLTPAHYSGGGIYFEHSAHCQGALLKDSIISHNSANYGGGVYNCAEIVNCTFTGNAAVDGFAGALDFVSDCETTVTDCTFNRNYAAGSAGAVYLGYSGTEVTFTRCSFIANSSDDKGGAIYSDGCTCGSYPTFYQCKFIANTAGSDGGAICNYGFSDTQLLSCLLVGNSSGGNGGALCDEYDAGSSLINCTVTNNTAAGQGGAICYDNYSYESRRLANTIIWANSDKNGQTHQYSQICFIDVSEVADVTNCCIQVIPPEIKGDGNITSNPLFVDIDGLDNIPGNEDDNLHLLEGSPCIDTGNNEYVLQPSTDLDGKPRIINGTVDRGAYEYARQQQGIIYVDDSATGANNGSSWKDAYNFLQDALAAATSGSEIRVAQGTYKPDQGVGKIRGDRTATFQLKNGVAVKGGYAGFGEPDPDTRDFVAYETILSGDIGTVADFSDNSYHIVQGGDNAILEGFTVAGGNANGLFQNGYGQGGGLYNDNCRIVVSNCTFEENAAFNGGAIFNAGGTLAVHESIFVANLASQGGALVNLNGHMTLTRCVLRNNAEGTIFCFGNGALQVESCVFDNNYGGWHTIDCSNTGSVIEVINSLFTHNAGGAINSSYNSLLIVNSTLVDNHTTTFGGGVCCSYGSLSAINCIMWGNTAEWGGDEIFGADARMTVSYSCIAGGHPGTGNINMNPLFCAPASGDYHLLAGSPCIDSGDNSAVPPSVTTDLDGKPRIMGKAVDMGAYELKPVRIIYVDDSTTAQ